MTIPFPNKKYQIIYADPPWQYKENWGNGSNEHTYPTLSFDEIKKIPVREIISNQAHLYLWVTNPFIAEGLELCREWGFNYKTLITWVKTYKNGMPEMGMGYYFRSCTEHIIFGTINNMKILNKTTRNMFQAVNPRYETKLHSNKPLIHEWIVKNSGDIPRIELFARQKVVGWDTWGNEVNNQESVREEREGK